MSRMGSMGRPTMGTMNATKRQRKMIHRYLISFKLRDSSGDEFTIDLRPFGREITGGLGVRLVDSEGKTFVAKTKTDGLFYDALVRAGRAVPMDTGSDDTRFEVVRLSIDGVAYVTPAHGGDYGARAMLSVLRALTKLEWTPATRATMGTYGHMFKEAERPMGMFRDATLTISK